MMVKQATQRTTVYGTADIRSSQMPVQGSYRDRAMEKKNRTVASVRLVMGRIHLKKDVDAGVADGLDASEGLQWRGRLYASKIYVKCWA